MSRVRITVDGKLALTVEQAAERYGVATLSTMRSIIRRAELEPDGQADGRTPLYLATTLDRMMRRRPGKGRTSPAGSR